MLMRSQGDNSLAIRLTEPCVFLRGGTDYSTSARHHRRRPAAMEQDPMAEMMVRPQAHEMPTGSDSPVPTRPPSPPLLGPAMSPDSAVEHEHEREDQVVMRHQDLGHEEEEEGPPAMLRGLLTLTLAKPTRIRKIDAKLKGFTRTEWPEGIGSRRMEVSDEVILVDETFTFFNAADKQSSSGAKSYVGRT
jgi:hypothetical protein